MSFLSNLEDGGGLKTRMKEANEFRVGVMGPASSGKSSIVAKLHQLKFPALSAPVDSLGDFDKDANLNKVLCVPVCRGQPLGFKIASSKSNSTWCCVHSFRPGAFPSLQSAVQADGRIMVGDLLVAIGDTTLMNKSPVEIVSILKAAQYDVDNHLLITFVRQGDGSQHTASGSSSSRNVTDRNNIDIACRSSTDSYDSSTTSQDQSNNVHLDHPTVMITSSYFCYSTRPSKPPPALDLTSYHLLPQSQRPTSDIATRRPSFVEIVDLPGNDPGHHIMREWLPRLDAIMLVYSAASTSSLLALENTYMRLITKLSVKEPFELPLVVVCNKAEDCPVAEQSGNAACCDLDSTALAELARKKNTLVMEGRAMAEAWNAPFFVTSCVEGGGISSSSSPLSGVTIVQENRRVCKHDGFELMFEAALERCLSLDTDSKTDCLRSSTAPSTAINTSSSSLFQFLPFVGECLALIPDEGGEHMASWQQQKHASTSSVRKLRKIEFSSPSRWAGSRGEADELAEVSSVVSGSEHDGDDDDNSSCSSCSSGASFCGSDDADYYGKDKEVRSEHRPSFLQPASRGQLCVKKKAGHTHDIWKLNYACNSSNTALSSYSESKTVGSCALSGLDIVGME